MNSPAFLPSSVWILNNKKKAENIEEKKYGIFRKEEFLTKTELAKEKILPFLAFRNGGLPKKATTEISLSGVRAIEVQNKRSNIEPEVFFAVRSYADRDRVIQDIMQKKIETVFISEKQYPDFWKYFQYVAEETRNGCEIILFQEKDSDMDIINRIKSRLAKQIDASVQNRI